MIYLVSSSSIIAEKSIDGPLTRHGCALSCSASPFESLLMCMSALVSHRDRESAVSAHVAGAGTGLRVPALPLQPFILPIPGKSSTLRSVCTAQFAQKFPIRL
jgi:hypothetical protein